jgi:hypothetical protein
VFNRKSSEVFQEHDVTFDTSADAERHKNKCNIMFLKNFRRFSIKHDIRPLVVKRVNYV